MFAPVAAVAPAVAPALVGVDWTQVIMAGITVAGSAVTILVTALAGYLANRTSRDREGASRERDGAARDRARARVHAARAQRAAIYIEQSMRPPGEGRPQRREADHPSNWPPDTDDDEGEELELELALHERRGAGDKPGVR